MHTLLLALALLGLQPRRVAGFAAPRAVLLQPGLPRLRLRAAAAAAADSKDEVWGREFAPDKDEGVGVDGPTYARSSFAPTKTQQELEPLRYWKGKPYRQLPAKERGKVMKSFDNLRATFLADSVFVGALGLCLAWSFGTWKDVVSFALGSALGLAYAVLLGRYVEGIGGQQKGGGAARFAPVILLVAVYGKYRTQLSIVPELLGFFSYQAASLLQIFNESAYAEEEEEAA